MNPLVLLVAFLLVRDARAIVELDCSDNATCIEHMAKEVIRSVRDQRTLKLFNVLTIEPLKARQARMARSMDSWLETFLDGNAFSFDWNDYTFRVSQADDSNALDLEILQGRTAKDVSDPNGKKSSTKNEEEKEEDKTPKLPGHRRPSATIELEHVISATAPISPVQHGSASATSSQHSHQTQFYNSHGPVHHITVSLPNTTPKHRRRRHKKKVMQMIIPMFFGMKSAGVVMFAMAVVTVLTLKAFMASKVALLVTVGMAAKKLYETYGTGVGLQNHPYLYSQYPIDFPSASSHAYSVSGVSPQFASPEMYSPTGMGAHSQTNEIIHQGDATAQQSQQAPTLLVNSTRAAERWDGKSKLLKLFEPLIEGVRNIIDPIANVFYGAMPATFRGLNSDVSTTNGIDPDDDLDELEIVKKPRQFLVPQPRNIAQRKMTYKKERKNRHRPKKYSELKISLDRLKNNKDLQDYIRTKKYKYNYPNTYFYPRVKYFVNPNIFLKPNNSRLLPYNKEASSIVNTTALPIITRDTEWKPIVFFNHTFPKNATKKHKRNFRKRHYKKRRNRTRRSIDLNVDFPNASARSIESRSDQGTGRFFFGFLSALFENDPIGKLVTQTAKYTKSKIDNSLQSDEPGYYSLAYNIVMMTLDVMEGIFEVNAALDDEYKTKKLKRKKDNVEIKYVSNCTQVEKTVESKGNITKH